MKRTIKMIYTGEKIKGQGVLSATKEQINLIETKADEHFNVLVNKRGKHDILHLHTVNPKSYFGAKYSKKPVVTHVHFLPDTLEGSIKLPRLFMGMFKKYVLSIYRNSDHIVVVNPSFIEELVKFNIKEERITYIPNFVNEKVFYKYDKARRNEVRKEFNVKEDEFVVVGVGQVQQRKGVVDFVETAKRLPHVRFIWAGGFSFGKITDGYKELKEIMDNPPKNVEFVGILDREKMTDFYNMSDLLFMPSFNELFPMAILESCSCENPIFVRDLKLFEPVLLDGYYRASDVDGFVETIDKLSKDKDYYNIAVRHALSVKEFYSRENVKNLWIDYYNGLSLIRRKKQTKIDKKNAKKQAKIDKKNARNKKNKEKPPF